MVQEFVPDARNRIDLLRVYRQDNPGNYLLHLDYVLDGEGNVLAIGSDTFTYDGQNRLKTAKIGGQTITYNLDVMGNRLAVVDATGTKTYTVADHNLVLAAGGTNYTYDSLGNTVGKTAGEEAWVYRYDEENRLRKVFLNGQEVASYWYDAEGKRIKSQEAGRTVYYLYDGLRVISEDEPGAGFTDYIFAGNLRVARKENNVITYYHCDHLGSTTLVTDANGRILTRIKHDPYGLPAENLSYPEEGSFEKASLKRLYGDPSLSNGSNVLVLGYRWRASMHYSPADEYCEVAISSTAASGTRVGRIYDNGSGTWKAFTFSKPVKLTPGKWYRISVKARAVTNPGTKYAAAYLSYNYNDAQSNKYVTKWVSWTPAELASGKWVMKYVVFKVPEGYADTNISPYLYGHYGAGIIEYDDYRIEEFDEEPAGPPVEEEPYRFTGKSSGLSTGLYYFGARYYDPEVARWTTLDPLRVGNNWYEYCYSNPLRFVDSTGEWPGDTMHRDETVRIASKMGFNIIDALAIGIASMSVDYQVGTLPFPLIGDLSWHFDMNSDPNIDTRINHSVQCLILAKQAMQEGKKEEALKWIGMGLHAVQDISAHANFDPLQYPYKHPDDYDNPNLDFDLNGAKQVGGASLEFKLGNDRYVQFCFDTEIYLNTAYDILYTGHYTDPYWWITE